MTKAEELINKHLDRLDANNIIGKDGNIYKGVLNAVNEALTIPVVVSSKRDETLELLEEIMTKVKDADSEVENGIYDPMLECARRILNNYKIERR